MKKTLITSALLYANGPAHFGHIAGAYLPADIHARYCRLKKDHVLFLSGSDEYGMPITLSAEKLGKSPKEHVDKFHAVNEELFQKLQISFDHYSRTTWEGHRETVEQFFQDLQKNGYIEEREEDQLYSPKEQRFLADRYVVGTCPKCGYTEARGDECTSCGANYESVELKNPRSKLTGSPLVLRKSRHYYLLFDRFKERLTKFLANKKWKENVREFSYQYIQELRPRAITRDSSWGIPVQLEDGSRKVFYVWFDAPIGYISAAKEWAQKKGEPDLWKDFWLDSSTRLVQFVGKDNIPFHSVFFPAMILGQNKPYKLVDELPANEFLQLEGKKFSKSDGNYIDLQCFFSTYSSDQIRYYLAKNAPETADADFQWSDFQQAVNADLVGKFGNFVHRVFTFARAGEASFPQKPKKASLQAIALEKDLALLWEKIARYYDTFQVRKAVSCLMEMASLGNVFFHTKAPWKLRKEGKEKEVEETLFFCFSLMKYLAVAAFPVLPKAASSLWRMLGFSEEIGEVSWWKIAEKTFPESMVISPPEVLFTRIEEEQIQKEKSMLQEKENKQATPEKKLLEFSQFSALDLRVVTILQAEKIAKSKKLLCLQVDLGEKQCQVISGIAETFSPEDLVGKKVLFVANLKPATIMGRKSEGMILAAGEGKKLELPSVENSAAGTVVS